MLRLAAVWLCVLAVALPNVAAVGMVSYNSQTARCTFWKPSERTPLPMFIYRASVLLIWLALAVGAFLNALGATPQPSANARYTNISGSRDERSVATRDERVRWNREDSRVHILNGNVLNETPEQFQIQPYPTDLKQTPERLSLQTPNLQILKRTRALQTHTSTLSNLTWGVQSAICLVYFMGYLTLWTERLVAGADERRLRDCEWCAILCSMRGAPLVAAYFRVLLLLVVHFCSSVNSDR